MPLPLQGCEVHPALTEEMEADTETVALKVDDQIEQPQCPDDKVDEDTRQQQDDREDAPGVRASSASVTDSTMDQAGPTEDEDVSMLAMFREMQQAVQQVVVATPGGESEQEAAQQASEGEVDAADPEENVQLEAEAATKETSVQDNQATTQFLQSWLLLEKKRQQQEEQSAESTNDTDNDDDDVSILGMFREIGQAAKQEIHQGQKVCSEALVQQMQWANEKLAARQKADDKNNNNEGGGESARAISNEDDVSMLAMFREIAEVADGSVGHSATSMMELMSYASRQARHFLLTHIAEPLLLTDKSATSAEGERGLFGSWW